MSNQEVFSTADAGNAPEAVKQFAERMAKAQGTKVKLSTERSGYHLYIPCPDCLHDHGAKEIEDPKYAINLSKHLAIGDQYQDLKVRKMSLDPTVMEAAYQAEEVRDKAVGICMRTRESKQPHKFSVRSLLNMGTVEDRHPDIRTRCEVIGGVGNADRESHWEPDENGVLCPPPPGDVIPITELPPSHPAVEYLTERGYNLQRLWEQFRCSFCTSEYPAGTNGIYYRKLPGGWADTPQHRIIFYSMVNGVAATWQGRYPERIVTNQEGSQDRYMLHPYDTVRPGHRPVSGDAGIRFTWSHVATRGNQQSAWVPVPPYDERDAEGHLRFNPSKGSPSKYRTAKYSNRELMGWDAAMARADADDSPFKWIVLCEGPLDAARVGPGGVALIGASISPENAVKVASNFHVAFTAFDNDLAGRAATQKIGQTLMGARQRNPTIQLVIPLEVSGGKDIGDMKQDEFDRMLKMAIRRSQRGT